MKQKTPRKLPLIIAHRGASDEAAENTMSAFILAEECGADGIELDIHHTSDGEFAVIHDEELGRTICGKGAISSMSSRELKNFEINFENSNASNKIDSEKVPLLSELYRHKITLPLMIEIKSLLEVEMLKNYLNLHCPLFFYKNDLIGSFSEVIVKKLIDHFPLNQIIGIADQKESIETFCAMGLKYLAISYELLDSKYLKDWQSQCSIWVWTVNDQKIAKLCCEKNIAAIITDHPRMMKKWMVSL